MLQIFQGLFAKAGDSLTFPSRGNNPTFEIVFQGGARLPCEHWDQQTEPFLTATLSLQS